MVVCVVTGLMVGDRRFPGATILGVEVVYTLRQPSGVSPADKSRTSRWLALWTVYEMAVPERSDGFTFLGRRQVASILSWSMFEMAGSVRPVRFLFLCLFWDFGLRPHVAAAAPPQ